MSGVFGICEPGRELSSELLLPMFAVQRSDGESADDSCGRESVAMGVASRWNFQCLAEFSGILVAADADLVEVSSLAESLPGMHEMAAPLSVAELIARLYLRDGLDFLRHLRGAFALALWDQSRKQLILAIDGMGIKSMYWRREGERLLFASRLGAVRAVQQEAPEVNLSAIVQFLLFSAVPAPMTSDQRTSKLRPGFALLFSSRGIEERQYWDLEYPEDQGGNTDRWSADLRDMMRKAVRRHLTGCEQHSTGCYLSGGTDSSSVVAFASEVLRPVHSFSIAFEETGFSEIEFARTSAKAFGSDHHEKFLSPRDAAQVIDKVVAFYEEPFANSSAIGSYHCALMARERGVNTLLAGDGGDELFAGNERYAQDKRFSLYHKLPPWLRTAVLEPIIGLLPSNDGKLSLPQRYVRRAKIANPRRILSYGFFLSEQREAIFEESFLDQAGRDNWLVIPEGHFFRAKASSELNRILYLDMKMTLADNDLRKVSGTAELAGVNVRYPLLDLELASFSGRIPASLKLKGFEKRFIFKEAMKGILPAKIIHKKKHGFGVPLAQWLLMEPRMKELTQDLMRDSKTQQRGYFRPGFFSRLMELHHQHPNFYGEIVWYLVALELWHRHHMEKRREAVHVL